MEISSSSYAFNLHFLGAGYAYFSVYTVFERFDDNHREVRAPDLCKTDGYMASLATIGRRAQLVSDSSDYDRWMLTRGWGVISKAFVRENMSQWLRARTCVSSATYGFIDVAVASPSALSRSVCRGKRSEILHRDSHCCLLCGTTQSPITMHHIRAFSLGGETTTRNLVALCEPCNQEQKTSFAPGLTDQPLGDLSMLGKNPKDGWYQKLVFLSSDLMFTRCEVF